MFDERKATQMAAYFLHKNGGRMNLLKLIKLMYLADRESLNECGFAISGNHYYSLDHGPVLSETLDLMRGSEQSDYWDQWISERDGHFLSLRNKDPEPDDFGRLSPADCDIMDRIWRKFGSWGHWRIRDYTHKHCPEWQDPQGSSIPIKEQSIFEALGVPKDQARQLAAHIDDQRHFHKILCE